jgi:cytochrome c biogenesis protein CcdA
MSGAPLLLLALTAGALAAVNPCGFALLPAYLALFVVGDDGRRTAVGRALLLTAAMTLGFLAVFAAFGLVLAPAAGLLQRHLPWFTIGLGMLLAVLGGWLLAGRQLPALPWRVTRAPALRRSWPSMALFGAAYALASLSCTIGPFLAIVVSGLRAGSLVAGLALFGAYAVGMGLLVGAAALATALARASLLHRIRSAAAVLGRVSGLLLLGTGGYVAWYGLYELRVTAGRVAADPVIVAGTAVQRAAAAGLDGPGVALVAGVFTLLLAGALVTGWMRRYRG